MIVSVAEIRERRLPMTLELPDLPYAYEALEPLISAATLRTIMANTIVLTLTR